MADGRCSVNDSLKEKIYQSLQQDILKGTYQPGVPFTEKELVERFQVSKSPIREALVALCSEGVLRNIPRCGYEVLKINEEDLKNVREFRILLECGALNRYWDTIKPEHLDTLETMLQADSMKPGNLSQHWERNSNFHLALISIFNNKYLYDKLDDSLRFMARAYVQYRWNKWQQGVYVGQSKTHKTLIAHIRDNEKEKALQDLENDINSFMRNE